MSRQLEQQAEERFARRKSGIIKAVEFGVERTIQDCGMQLTGVAFKMNGGDCLAIVKASSADGPLVCFVGAEDWGSVLMKLVREGQRGRLRWKPDEYVG